jgi:hypothetical protein
MIREDFVRIGLAGQIAADLGTSGCPGLSAELARTSPDRVIANPLRIRFN